MVLSVGGVRRSGVDVIVLNSDFILPQRILGSYFEPNPELVVGPRTVIMVPEQHVTIDFLVFDLVQPTQDTSSVYGYDHTRSL